MHISLKESMIAVISLRISSLVILILLIFYNLFHYTSHIYNTSLSLLVYKVMLLVEVGGAWVILCTLRNETQIF